jgi:hypothetical protein
MWVEAAAEALKKLTDPSYTWEGGVPTDFKYEEGGQGTTR